MQLYFPADESASGSKTRLSIMAVGCRLWLVVNSIRSSRDDWYGMPRAGTGALWSRSAVTNCNEKSKIFGNTPLVIWEWLERDPGDGLVPPASDNEWYPKWESQYEPQQLQLDPSRRPGH
jgi:hypothetical protein